MPCGMPAHMLPTASDYNSGRIDQANESFNKRISNLEAQANEYKEKGDKAYQFLCYMCAQHETNKNIDQLPLPIQQWWSEHKQQDAKRVIWRVETFKENGITRKQALNILISDAEQIHPLSNWHKNIWFPSVIQTVYDQG